MDVLHADPVRAGDHGFHLRLVPGVQAQLTDALSNIGMYADLQLHLQKEGHGDAFFLNLGWFAKIKLSQKFSIQRLLESPLTSRERMLLRGSLRLGIEM